MASNSRRSSSKKSGGGGTEPLSSEGAYVGGSLTNCIPGDGATSGNHGNPITLATLIDSGEPSGAEDEGSDSPEAVLAKAGVELNLAQLHPSVGGAAPLELTTQFLACVMDDEFPAAKILCEKILEIEPSHSTASEFLPVLLERLKLDATLPSESSSESSDSSEEESEDDSEEGEGEEEGEEEVSNSHHRSCSHHV